MTDQGFFTHPVEVISTIYVVQGESGEYSDRSGWDVRAFTKEEDAKAYVGLLCIWVRERVREHLDRVSDLKNPYDPNMFWCSPWDEPRYFISPVPLSADLSFLNDI